MKNQVLRINLQEWWKLIRENRVQTLLLVLIFLLAIFLRFYQVPEYMTFLGDEGRDALAVRGLLVDHHFPLIGPPMSVSTGVGQVYLGPLYYYMMAVAMFLSGMNPVGAAYMISVIGTLTVGLIYWLAQKWFGKEGALLAAFAYAISPVVVNYSRSSWNPNPLPFFTILAFFGLNKSIVRRDFKWFVLSGICLAFAVQMHYLGLILLPIFGVLWMYELYKKIKNPKDYKNFYLGTILAVIAFLFLMSPLLIFDLRHNFINFKALESIFIGDKHSVDLNPLANLLRVLPIFFKQLIGRYLAAEMFWSTLLLSILVLLPLIWMAYLKVIKKAVLKWSILALAIWLGLGLIGLSLYSQQIYDHYLFFLSPVPFLLLAGLVCFCPKRWKYWLVGALAILIAVLNFGRFPFRYPPDNQLQRTQQIAKFIIQQSNNQPFNFALLSQNNYDAAYQFYLIQDGYAPKKLPFDITNQLFVVCEDPVCQPTTSSKYEIVAFGWTKVDQEFNIDGVKVYKLAHNGPYTPH